MTSRIIIPHLDANIIDVTVTQWCKEVGDEVRCGEVVAVLTTDKAAFDLEAPADGILLEILAAAKSVVPSGYILGIIGAAGEHDADAVAVNNATMAAYREATGIEMSAAATADAPVATAAAAPAPVRVRATPRARRLAQQLGLDLAAVQAATGVEVVDETALRQYQER